MNDEKALRITATSTPVVVAVDPPSFDQMPETVLYPGIINLSREEANKLKDESRNCLIISVIAFLIFPFWPFGITAVVFAWYANDAINYGNTESARKNLDSARCWNIANVTASVICYFIIIISVLFVIGIVGRK
ncbi:unnamed protein product [Dimorphilus gyrociliatus]|uniref:Uncharacterized protein n=1 Tax=Dimorphilus gyrociliatus TaxID=2664684 RepID=A0A7I8VS32_9ANNE|nr:unnamed protein product [Dimorphilus gyrociliatus]